MTRTCCLSAVLLSLVGFLAGGCSGGGGTTITGKVTLDNQPLDNAKLEFVGEGPSLGTVQAKTGADGKFELQPVGKEKVGLKPGKYKVLVSKLVDKKTGKVPNEEDYGQLEAANMLKDVLKGKYSDRDFPKITIEVKEGEKELAPIELKSK